MLFLSIQRTCQCCCFLPCGYFTLQLSKFPSAASATQPWLSGTCLNHSSLGSWAPCSLLPTGHEQRWLLPFAVADLKCQLRDVDLESPARLRTRILQSSCSVGLHPHTLVLKHIGETVQIPVFQPETHIFAEPQIPHRPPRPPRAAGTWSWCPPCSTRH